MNNQITENVKHLFKNESDDLLLHIIEQMILHIISDY